MAILSKRHVKDISSIIEKILFLCSYHVYFILWNKSKSMLQSKIKDLTFQASSLHHFLFLKLSPMRDGQFMTSTQKGGSMKFVKCLQIVLFDCFRQHIYCLKLYEKQCSESNMLTMYLELFVENSSSDVVNTLLNTIIYLFWRL